MNLWSHHFFQNPNQKLQRFLLSLLINFQGRNLCNFWLGFWKKRWPHKFILNSTDLYNKSFVFDTHFFVFVIRIKLFLMSLLTMAFKKSFLYKTYSLWTFSKILFFYLQGTKKCCSLCGTLTVPSDLRRVFLWFF